MKNYTLILLVAAIVVIGCNNNRSESRPIDKRVTQLIGKIQRGEIALPADSTLLDLFYGMERSKEFSGYMQRDTILENTPNIVKSENTAWWYYNPDKMKFRSTLGLYIDKDYPSQKVFQRLEEAIDTTMVNGLSYYFFHINADSVYNARRNNLPQNSADIFKFATSLFDQTTQSLQPNTSQSEYDYYLDFRVCVVAHKVFEQEGFSTYLLESSGDYNGSSGCPSDASYITLENESGRTISADNIIKRRKRESFKKLLYDKYYDYMTSEGYESYLISDDVDWIWESKSGISLINEGVLVFYKPYSIGPGAMGQVNLIIPYSEM
jgi:hypothetical protein